MKRATTITVVCACAVAVVAGAAYGHWRIPADLASAQLPAPSVSATP